MPRRQKCAGRSLNYPTDSGKSSHSTPAGRLCRFGDHRLLRQTSTNDCYAAQGAMTADGRPATAGSRNCSLQTGRSDLVLNVSKVASISPTGAPALGHEPSAASRRNVARDHAKRRGTAADRGAEDRERAAAVDAERQVGHRVVRAVVLVDTLRFNVGLNNGALARHFHALTPAGLHDKCKSGARAGH